MIQTLFGNFCSSKRGIVKRSCAHQKAQLLFRITNLVSFYLPAVALATCALAFAAALA